MKFKYILFMLIPVILTVSCNKIKLEKYTVSATLVKSAIGEYDVATVLLGKLSVDIPIYIDNYSASDSAELPGNVEPVKDAIVKVGDVSLPMTAPGVYSKANMSIEYKKSYPLTITIGDSVELESEAVVPDSFSIISPITNDTVDMHGIRVVWHKSDSASFYVVYVDDAEDSTVTVNGYENVVNDTSIVLPDSCFEDLDGSPVQGFYQIHVVAVNGAWKHGALSFILGGGNVDGAWGTYAITTKANNDVKVYIRRN